MILPDSDKCRDVLDKLANEPNLSAFERDFLESNEDRAFFTERQREVVADLMVKYTV
jgi:hypothetical protein